jgi:inner membrane protein involved in colicin E2 resistance
MLSHPSAPMPAWLPSLACVLIVGFVVCAPLFLLRGLIAERIQLHHQVQVGAAEGWGDAQIIAGPAIEIPLIAGGMPRGHVALLPQALDASVDLFVERRSRGPFEALI